MLNYRILHRLATAAETYVRLEDWQHTSRCHHIVAIIYDALGDHEAREEAAELWLKYKALAKSISGMPGTDRTTSESADKG